MQRLICGRRNICMYLRCAAKMCTVVFWVVLYFMVMKVTLFKSSVSSPPVNDWELEPDQSEKNAMAVSEVSEKEPENYEEWENAENDTAILRELNERAATVQRVCKRRGLTSKKKINSNEFFIDKNHSLVWCNIFKAASSYWIHNFNILGGYNASFLSKTRQVPLMLARRKFPRPSQNEVRDAFNTSGITRLIVVREPFVRLLSAYRDKLENSRLKYYRKIGKIMISKHRNNASKIFGPIKSNGPTFYEFVAELIDKRNDLSSYNEHWMPYYKFCSPCAVNFNVIAKVETFKRDNGFVIRRLGLGPLLKSTRIKNRTTHLRRVLNKSPGNKSTSLLMKSYFQQLDKNMLDNLLKIYVADFEMFGYDPGIYDSYVRK